MITFGPHHGSCEYTIFQKTEVWRNEVSTLKSCKPVNSTMELKSTSSALRLVLLQEALCPPLDKL